MLLEMCKSVNDVGDALKECNVPVRVGAEGQDHQIQEVKHLLQAKSLMCISGAKLHGLGAGYLVPNPNTDPRGH